MDKRQSEIPRSNRSLAHDSPYFTFIEYVALRQTRDSHDGVWGAVTVSMLVHEFHPQFPPTAVYYIHTIDLCVTSLLHDVMLDLVGPR